MPTTPTVAFDESGNSGGNLLDPNQPVAVLASAALTEDEADECLSRLRSVTRQPASGEIHFRGLKSARARQGVLEMLSSDALDPESVRVVLAHKQFMAVCKLVDLTLEPFFHSLGVNMYDRDGAVATANLLHFVAPQSSGSEPWDRLLKTFNAACGRPNAQAFEAFYAAVSQWRDADRLLHELADALQEASRWLPGSLLDPSGDASPDPVDPALPHFVLLARSWTDHFDRDFSILHDHSEAIERWRVTLLNLEQLPNVAKPNSMLERLAIVEHTFDASADSSQHSRLQVVDVIGGSVRTWATSLAQGRGLDAWPTALRDLTEPWVVDAVWPDAQYFDGHSNGPPDLELSPPVT